MTPDHAMKLRAGDFVTNDTRPGEIGIVQARRGHLLCINWPHDKQQFLLTYDAGALHRLQDPNP